MVSTSGSAWWVDRGLLMSSPRWKRGGLRMKGAPINRYGRFALRAWQELAPQALRQIPNPNLHFSRLGEEAELQVAELALQIAGFDVPGETYLGKVGRLNAAKLQAEEIVRVEMLTPPAEPFEDDQEDPIHPGPLQLVMESMQELTDEYRKYQM